MVNDDAKDEPKRLKTGPKEDAGRRLLGEDKVSQDDRRCAQDGS